MAFTSHGHHISGTVLDDTDDNQRVVARCGGPGLCEACSVEATQIMKPKFQDVIDLGPELFVTGDGTVIGWKGEWFYKACGELVYKKPEGGATHCVKRVGHPGWDHEDFDGNLRDRNFGMPRSLEWEVRDFARKALLQTGLDDEEIFNALNALQYAGVTLSKEP